MWNKPLQGPMAKYVHEFYAGCKCDLRISILPQLFYPKFTVVCGSGDAIALGWVSFSVIATEKAHSSKSYFVCPVWPIPITAQHIYCLKWTGVSGMGCWLGRGGWGPSQGSPKTWHSGSAGKLAVQPRGWQCCTRFIWVHLGLFAIHSEL